MKFIVFIISFFILLNGVFSQETIFEETTTRFIDEYSGGVNLHTNGFALNYRYSQYSGAFFKRSYEIEFATIKHPKEIKTISPFEEDVRGYVFGKLNSFFVLRPSIGFHKIIIPKQSIRGVSITRVFQLGASIGFSKPIYLNIREREIRNPNSFNIALRKYDPELHQQNDIYGRASFFKGFDEIKIHPGVFGKYGLEFEYSNQKDVIRSIEVGIMADFYLKEVPIMAFTKNQNLYLNLYAGFRFGQKNTK